MARPKSGYSLADGTKVPGTTTITGRFKDSGALMFWAFNQGKSGASSLYDASDKAKDIGTLAHEMVEEHIHGRPPEKILDAAPEELRAKAMQAFYQYVEWEKNTGLKIVATETPLVSEKYRYGGTLDAVAEMNGTGLVLLDWKTSSGIFPEFLTQVAAYSQLWNENNPGKRINTAFICRFSKDFPDFTVAKFGDLEQPLEFFLTLRKAFDMDKDLSKRVK